LRNVQDWNKYVDMLGKAVAAKPSVPVVPPNGVKPARETPAGAADPPRKGRARRRRARSCYGA